MIETIYSLCTIVAFFCSVKLFKAHKESSYGLLYWSGMCFALLALTNAFVILDKLIMPFIDLHAVRLSITLLGMGVLIYGLIIRSE